MRDRDLKTVMQNEHHKRAAMKQFQSMIKAFPVIRCKAEMLEKASEYRSINSVWNIFV
jgi:hypothetical protein